jgi:hypothetical protein
MGSSPLPVFGMGRNDIEKNTSVMSNFDNKIRSTLKENAVEQPYGKSGTPADF